MNFRKEKARKPYNGGWWLRRFLDTILEDRLTHFIPFGYAFVMLILFYSCTKFESFLSTLIGGPIILALWYFGLFYLLHKQNEDGEGGMKLDLIEAAILFFAALLALASFVLFFFNFRSGIVAGGALGALTWSSVAFAHNRRDD